MHITVIAVGKLKERYWRDAADEYLKRLRPYADVAVVEVPDRDSSKSGVAKALAEEASDILKALPHSGHVIALDVQARPVSSEALAARLDELSLHGRSSVAFIVGGSHGLDGTVLSRADERVSFGPVTLPHNLARIVLLEQVYRSFRISRGEPYHK